jgi:hypothetical protein
MADYNYASGGFPTTPVTNDTLIINGTSYIYNGSAWEVVGGAGEGTSILSTGETGAVKYLREDGDGTSSWQAVAGGGIGEFIDTSIAISSDDTALANDDGTANNNIGIGANAGAGIVNHYDNIAIGNDALQTYGANVNIAIGGRSCRYMKGEYSIALGYKSLYGNVSGTTGSFNIGIGHSTGYNLTTGTHNSLQGYQSAYNLTTGSHNVTNGYQAGFALTAGSYNVLQGWRTGKSITSAYYNVALGGIAGGGLITGAKNVIVGHEAAKTYNFDRVTAVGYQAGELNQGSDNVFLGHRAGRTETASNKLHIANNSTESLIEGDFAAKTVNINGALTVNGTAVGGGGGIETKNIDSSTTYTLSNADKGKSLYVNNNTFNTVNLPNPSTLDSDFYCYVHTTENVQDGYGNSGEIGIDPQYSTTSKRINGTSAAWTMYPDQFGLLTIDPSAAGWTFSVQNTGMDLRINGTLNWGSASAAGWAGIAMGGQSSAGGTHSMGLGVNANASANESTALGYYAQATGNTSVALANSKAGGTNSFAAAIGNNSSSYGASGTSSTAIGINAKAYSNYAVAIGWGAQAGNRACTFGGYNSIAGDNAGCLNTYSSSIVNAYSTGVGGLYASDHSIQGRFVLASADSLGGLGASQTSHYMVTGVTTNATQYTITGNSATTINGGNLMKIAPKSASTFSINIVAKQQGTSTNTAAWKIEGLIRQEANAAATTLVSSNLTVISNVPGWGDPVVVANTAHGALEVKVTGAASTNIKWGATIWSTEIIYT